MTTDPSIVKLNNVRLSIPTLFEPKSFQGGAPKYSATFILDKKTNAAEIKAINDAIKAVVAEKFKGKAPSNLKVALHEGNEKEHLDGYGEGTMYISTSCDKRPTVVNRDLTPLAADDNVLFAGCYVNATIRLWGQDNQFGKRVNAQLRAVQYYKTGEAFGDKPVDATSEFTAVADEEGVV